MSTLHVDLRVVKQGVTVRNCAEVAAHLGHPEDGLQALAEAHTLMEPREERW